jgi:hypothetical protein
MVLAFLMAALVLMLTALGLYHWVFLKGAREGWPIIGSVIKLVTKDEFDQRDRYLRENLDLMARQLGEMQAKLTQLESLGERVSGLAGVSVETHKSAPGQGGIQVGAHALSLDQVKAAMDDLETLTHQRTDLLTVLESRLFERRMKSMMVPTQRPVSQGDVGSPFGWRLDPMTGLSALHTGLDFPGPVGTPILAAAGGVLWWLRNTTPPTEKWSRSIMATNWSPAMPMRPGYWSRRAILSSAVKPLPKWATPGARPVLICILRYWFKAYRRTRTNSWSRVNSWLAS